MKKNNLLKILLPVTLASSAVAVATPLLLNSNNNQNINAISNNQSVVESRITRDANLNTTIKHPEMDAEYWISKGWWDDVFGTNDHGIGVEWVNSDLAVKGEQLKNYINNYISWYFESPSPETKASNVTIVMNNDTSATATVTYSGYKNGTNVNNLTGTINITLRKVPAQELKPTPALEYSFNDNFPAVDADVISPFVWKRMIGDNGILNIQNYNENGSTLDYVYTPIDQSTGNIQTPIKGTFDFSNIKSGLNITKAYFSGGLYLESTGKFYAAISLHINESGFDRWQVYLLNVDENQVKSKKVDLTNTGDTNFLKSKDTNNNTPVIMTYQGTNPFEFNMVPYFKSKSSTDKNEHILIYKYSPDYITVGGDGGSLFQSSFAEKTVGSTKTKYFTDCYKTTVTIDGNNKSINYNNSNWFINESQYQMFVDKFWQDSVIQLRPTITKNNEVNLWMIKQPLGGTTNQQFCKYSSDLHEDIQNKVYMDINGAVKPYNSVLTTEMIYDQPNYLNISESSKSNKSAADSLMFSTLIFDDTAGANALVNVPVIIKNDSSLVVDKNAGNNLSFDLQLNPNQKNVDIDMESLFFDPKAKRLNFASSWFDLGKNKAASGQDVGYQGRNAIVSADYSFFMDYDFSKININDSANPGWVSYNKTFFDLLNSDRTSYTWAALYESGLSYGEDKTSVALGGKFFYTTNLIPFANSGKMCYFVPKNNILRSAKTFLYQSINDATAFPSSSRLNASKTTDDITVDDIYAEINANADFISIDNLPLKVNDTRDQNSAKIASFRENFKIEILPETDSATGTLKFKISPKNTVKVLNNQFVQVNNSAPFVNQSNESSGIFTVYNFKTQGKTTVAKQEFTIPNMVNTYAQDYKQVDFTKYLEAHKNEFFRNLSKVSGKESKIAITEFNKTSPNVNNPSGVIVVKGNITNYYDAKGKLNTGSMPFEFKINGFKKWTTQQIATTITVPNQTNNPTTSYTKELAKSFIETNINKILKLYKAEGLKVTVESFNNSHVSTGAIDVSFNINGYYYNNGVLQNQTTPFTIKLTGFKSVPSSHQTTTISSGALSGVSNILPDAVKNNDPTVINALIKSGLIKDLVPNQTLTANDVSFTVNSSNVIDGTIDVNVTIKNNKAWKNGQAQSQMTFNNVSLSGFKKIPADQQTTIISSGSISGVSNIVPTQIRDNDPKVIDALINSGLIKNLAPNQKLTKNDISYTVNSADVTTGSINVNVVIKNNKAWQNGVVQASKEFKNVRLSGFLSAPVDKQTTVIKNGNITGFENVFPNTIQTNDPKLIDAIINSGLVQNLVPGQTLTPNDIYVSVNGNNPVDGSLNISVTIKNSKTWTDGVINPSKTFNNITISGFKKDMSSVNKPNTNLPTNGQVVVVNSSKNPNDLTTAEKEAIVRNELEKTMGKLPPGAVTVSSDGKTATINKYYGQYGEEVNTNISINLTWNDTSPASDSKEWVPFVIIIASITGAILICIIVVLIFNYLRRKNAEAELANL